MAWYIAIVVVMLGSQAKNTGQLFVEPTPTSTGHGTKLLLLLNINLRLKTVGNSGLSPDTHHSISWLKILLLLHYSLGLETP